jgi:hypothetical protein
MNMMEATLKAQTSTLTQTRNTSRSRRILVLIAGLVVLAAAIIGAVLALNQRVRAPEITSRASAYRQLIAYCRVCADEALAARQGVVPSAGRATQSVAANINTRPLIAYCRVCADEALAAYQSPVPASRSATAAIARIFNTRALAVQCRVCLDEALGGTSTGVDTAELPLDQPASAELLRRNGPR